MMNKPPVAVFVCVSDRRYDDPAIRRMHPSQPSPEGGSTRRILIAAALACGLCVGLSARAADKKDKEYKGVVIDNACGAKQMSKANPEEAAEGHPKSCALKCAKGGDGFS